jgi:hypothetical protein
VKHSGDVDLNFQAAERIDLSSPCIYQGDSYYYVDCLEKLSEARRILLSPLSDCEPLNVDTESSITI